MCVFVCRVFPQTQPLSHRFAVNDNTRCPSSIGQSNRSVYNLHSRKNCWSVPLQRTNPSGPRVTPLPVFICVPEEFVGPFWAPNSAGTANMRVCVDNVVLCMCVCRHFHVVHACMHVCVCVYACCVCMVHVCMRECMLCVWVLGGPSGPRVTRACMYALCVCGCPVVLLDPGSPVVCWAI